MLRPSELGCTFHWGFQSLVHAHHSLMVHLPSGAFHVSQAFSRLGARLKENTQEEVIEDD